MVAAGGLFLAAEGDFLLFVAHFENVVQEQWQQPILYTWFICPLFLLKANVAATCDFHADLLLSCEQHLSFVHEGVSPLQHASACYACADCQACWPKQALCCH